MMFSSRVPPHREPNRLARAVEAIRASGRPLIDLTVTNPTVCGFTYPRELLAPLGSSSGLVYTPSPLGLDAAREAVAQDYARRSIAVDKSRIVLTTSTSEAYSILFKLLCDPGETVLVPAPSYPLFDHLTRLDGIRTRTYALEYHGRWCLDAASLERAWREDVRAVLGVSPNNPTGSLLSAEEVREVDARCARHGAAFVLDEVFADYRITSRPRAVPHEKPSSLTFRLGGLSKSAGLPQVKLGWIAVEGPDALVFEALERLELICDTYLSVSTPVQLAAPTMLREAAVVRDQIQNRIVGNFQRLAALAEAHPAVDVLPVEAGWSAVIRVPGTKTEEDLVLELLERDGVLVHPGFFFDFPAEAFLVMSLLPEPERFAEGIERVLERVHV